MPLNQEVARSIFAAWRIARFDAGAMNYFNLTLEGFWRSFFAAGLVLPFYLVLTGLQFSRFTGITEAEATPSQLALGDVSLMAFVAVDLVNFACAWVAWPLLMVPIAGFFGLSRNYVPYIIATNWASVLQRGLLIAVNVLMLSGVFPQGLVAVLVVIAYVSVLYYDYLIARAGLDCEIATAIGLVALKAVVTIGINIAFNAVY